MIAAITGAAIGFLVWAFLFVWAAFDDDFTINLPTQIVEIIAFSGSGAAIGWLAS